MKLLFSTNQLYAGTGGAQRVVSLLCNELARQGHIVKLILYRERDREEYYISENVEVDVLPNRNDGENKISYYIRKLRELKKEIIEFDPDVIIPFLSEPMWYAYLATCFTKYRNRIITTVRNNPHLFPKQRNIRWRNNVLIFLSKACFVQNEEQKAYFPSVIRKKTFVLPNPVSDELFSSKRQDCDITKLITMGRLSGQKNHGMMIEAFAKLSEKYPQLCLDIYGDGDLKNSLDALICERGLEGKVCLRGITTDVKGALLSHGLFIMTSNYEGMPNALIEAMATGMPCISTDCPTGPSDLIKTMESGILIPMNNVEKCAEAIEYMISNPEAAMKMGRRGREKIKESLVCERIAGQFLSYCDEYIINRR